MPESSIKKGTLVKGWSGAENKYCIGFYFGSRIGRHDVIDHFTGDMLAVNRIVEIPPELAKQLEELGNENLRRSREGCGKKLDPSYWAVECGERQMGGGIVLCEECKELEK